MYTLFLNTTLIPNMISKCMEGYKSECMKLKAMLEDKQVKIDTMMNKVGPNIPLSDTIIEVLNGIQEYFKDDDNDMPSDDEDDIDENNVQEALSKLVNKRGSSIKLIEDEKDDEEEDEEEDEKDDEKDDEEEDDEEDKDDEEEDEEEDKDLFFLKIDQGKEKKKMKKKKKMTMKYRFFKLHIQAI